MPKIKSLVAAVVAALLTGVTVGLATTASATPDPDNYVVYDDFDILANGGTIQESLHCDSGDTALGGGFAANNTNVVNVTVSAPVRTGAIHTPAIGWTVNAINNGTSDRTIHIHVICQDT